MLKRLLLLPLLLVLCFYSFAQQGTGSASGTITSVEGDPLDMVSISLVELRKGTLTDSKGNFTLNNITPGRYTVRIQMIGMKVKDIPVEIKPGENAIVDYKLTEENIRALQEVTVS